MSAPDHREEVIQSPPGEASDERRSLTGRPPHEPTPAQRARVKQLVAYGINQEVICDLIGISPHTLRKHYALEIKIGNAETIEKVANSLVAKAVSDRPDAVNAAKFYLQSRGDWAEKTEDVTQERHEDRIEKRKEALDRARGRRNGEAVDDAD